MKVEPYASVDGVAFGSDEAAVTRIFGRPARVSKNRYGERELHYSKVVARLAEGRLVEVTCDSRAVHLGGIAVQFSNLGNFLSENDGAVFQWVGFTVSPRYGIAFDPNYASWVTAFPRERLSRWREVGSQSSGRALSPAEAVAHSYMNREEIEQSELCGCYRCLAQFPSSDVRLWTDSMDDDDEEPGAVRASDARHKGFTAICPRCEDAAVIGSASGADISEEFLRAVHAYWTAR